MFDCIIIGAGIIGTSIARNLSQYKVNCLVIEKNSDVGDETSCANSAIVHSGYDPHPNTNKAIYNVLGNKMFESLCHELDVEFKKIGSLTISTSTEEDKKLEELYHNGITNGVDVRLISKEELWEMEPFATKSATKALYAVDAGIVNPFELCIASMENAMDNGVQLKLNEKVTNIKKTKDQYLVITDKDQYLSKVVINCAGVNSDIINNLICPKKEKIIPRKGEYYVLDHFNAPYVTHTLFSLPSEKGKGILVSPTTHGNYLIGPSSEFSNDKEDKDVDKETLDNIIKEAKRLVDVIPMKYLIREFSGVRAYHQSNDFVINMPEKGFINLLGIQSPGLASSPAIAKHVCELTNEVLTLIPKETYQKGRRKVIRLNNLSDEERQELVKNNPDFGKMICRCEKVSLGEVLDCIHRNCGATTIKGVKKRCRPGFGKCQGGFCEPLVLEILSNELGKNRIDINYANEGSYILTCKTKGEKND